MNHVVVFDQDRCVADLIRQVLEESGNCHVMVARHRADILPRLSSAEHLLSVDHAWALIVDAGAMEAAGMARFCRAVRRLRPDIGIVATFGAYQPSFDPGRQALRLFKPFSNQSLLATVAALFDRENASS